MDTEMVERSAFQPDHECNWDLTESGEDAEPGAGITDVLPHHFQRKRYTWAWQKPAVSR